MDEILVANFMIFQEVLEEGLYDLVIGDEAWDVDYYWHENPELKRGTHVWLTDFVGYLPMPDGGDHEAYLTADYNAEMIEHIARFPRIRDRAIFVGNPDDIYPETSGRGCPRSGTGPRSTSTSPATSPASPPVRSGVGGVARRTRIRAGREGVRGHVGGSGVGHDLLEKVIAAYPHAKELVPELRMVAVAGPRIDPASLPTPRTRGARIRRSPLPAPVRLRRRCGAGWADHHDGAGRRPAPLPLLPPHQPLRAELSTSGIVSTSTGPGAPWTIGRPIPTIWPSRWSAELGRPVNYRPVETDGAERAARMIADLI
jgi:hypothetical protein